MSRSTVDAIPKPLILNNIMARAYEVQMRDDYCFWLQELHRFLLPKTIYAYVGCSGSMLDPATLNSLFAWQTVANMGIPGIAAKSLKSRRAA